ncbi:MFS transporter [Actinacidiphila yeochonensis]|uniref:MFS transporter n=1 Tax=Actinacidiphila yeochonensis TaxID=89050 RepID=UPI00068EAD0A|nr:MFS transporter [Actinacidiphila yeochonensis]
MSDTSSTEGTGEKGDREVEERDSAENAGNSGEGGRTWLWLCAVCGFFVGLDSLVVSPLAPSITRATGTTTDYGGLLVTAYALLFMLGAPLFGPICDRWGRKRMILAGLLVFLGGTALTGTGDSFALILVFRAVSGVGAAMVVPSIFALISDRVPYERRGAAMGIVVGAMMAASVLGVPLGSAIAQVVSWRWTFRLVAVAAVVLLAAVWAALPDAPPAVADPSTGPVREWASRLRTALSLPPVVFTLLSTLLWTAGLQGMFANAGLFYNREFGLTPGEAGLALAGGGAASVIGNVYGGRIADRVGRRGIIAAASAVAAGSVVAFSLLTGSLPAAVAVQAVWGLAVGFGQSSLTTLVSELSPRARGTALALNSSAQYGGMMAGTAAAAALLSAGAGFWAVGVLCGGCAVVVVPIVVFLVRERGEEQDVSPKPQGRAPEPAR